MRVYVIRHGESESNRNRTFAGWLDAHLTEKGRADAAKAGEVLQKLSFDKIFSSDLSRARETAEIALPGCEYETSELLREICVGALAGNSYDTMELEKRLQMAKTGYQEFGGESREEHYQRLGAFLNILEALPYESVAVFSHAGCLRGFLDIVLGMEHPRDRVVCNNCAMLVLEFQDGKWKFYSWTNIS